jgi:hypothetical protein
MSDKVEFDNVFIAKDGTIFLKAKDCRMYDEIQHHAERSSRTYHSIVDKITLMKCQAFLSDSETKPIMSNIESCYTLPRIEEICKRAREEYINALNKPGRVDNPARVDEIFRTSQVYKYALLKRIDLIDDLKRLKAQAKEAKLEVFAAKMLKNNCEK